MKFLKSLKLTYPKHFIRTFAASFLTAALFAGVLLALSAGFSGLIGLIL